MKNLSTAIYGKLSGSTLESLIGGRMTKGRAKQGWEYPYVVYSIITGNPEYTFTETFEDSTYQFSLFSALSSTDEIEDMYTALKALYDEAAMTVVGSIWYHWMKRVNATLIAEEHTTKAGTIEVWHYAVDYGIQTLNST